MTPGVFPPESFFLSRDAVRAVDRAAIEVYGIPGAVLMENAAIGLADEAIHWLGAGALGAKVLIICGSGNNGGDGYALARHLHNRGARPVLVPLGEPRPGSDAALNLAICRRMGLPEVAPADLDRHRDADLVVDAIFGTGLDRPVAGAAAEAIAWINRSGRRVLAVDVPSGLDCDTGRPLGAAVRAGRTVTFVAPKPGFAMPGAGEYTGAVTVVGIGAPVELIARFGRPAADRR